MSAPGANSPAARPMRWRKTPCAARRRLANASMTSPDSGAQFVAARVTMQPLGLCGSVLGTLDLKGITLFGQDWGGLIGLRLVAAFPDRFARVVLSNTRLPVGTWSSPEFDAWLTFSQTTRSSWWARSSTPSRRET